MSPKLAIGLMSGTSLDGIDAALIETDGMEHVRPVAFRCEPWSDAARSQLADVTSLALTYERPRQSPEVVAASALVDRSHATAVRKLLNQAGLAADAVAVVGFHGQTIAHRPDRGWTWQIGDGSALARATGIATVADFRSADIAAGGQGAPLLPVYHLPLLAGEEHPVAVLNLGGVANLTWIGRDGSLLAFDTGPANGLIDAWMEANVGARFDKDGATAAAGTADGGIVAQMLDHPFFDAAPPKSLDRHDFTTAPVRGLGVPDGAATLARFTAEAVADALRHLPEPPRKLWVAGGGRHNPVLMRMIAEATALEVRSIDDVGCNGDAIEAEGFAYMAVRRLRNLPISFPGTTGTPRPTVGGRLFEPG